MANISGNKCYKMEIKDYEEGLNWNEALAECRGLKVNGLHDIDLATFTNKEENGRALK